MRRHSEIVAVGPASIETYVDGDGGRPDIVILPSYGRDGGDDFDPFTAALADAGYRVLRPQPRGIVRSTGPMTDVTLGDLADDIASVIGKLGTAGCRSRWRAGALPRWRSTSAPACSTGRRVGPRSPRSAGTCPHRRNDSCNWPATCSVRQLAMLDAAFRDDGSVLDVQVADPGERAEMARSGQVQAALLAVPAGGADWGSGAAGPGDSEHHVGSGMGHLVELAAVWTQGRGGKPEPLEEPVTVFS